MDQGVNRDLCDGTQDPGGAYAIRLQEYSYETKRNVSLACDERFAHDVYAKDNLHTYFSCTAFFAKTARTQF